MPQLPECHSRRTIDDDSRRFYCAHPRVFAARQLVTTEMCRVCTLWKDPAPNEFRAFPPRRLPDDEGACFHLGEQTGLRNCASCRGTVQLKTFQCRHPLHGEVTLRDCRSCADFESSLRRGTVETWAVGMTTAPRENPTIDRCLDSLAAAGWDEVRIFAEPDSSVPAGRGGISVSQRDQPLGVLANWFLGLAELLHREPEADAYLMLQDDVVFARNVRCYLESVLWPAQRAGVVSVYSPEPYGQEEGGFHQVKATDGLLGALTWIFPRPAAQWLVTSGLAHFFRWQSLTDTTRQLDTLIGRILAQTEWPLFYHTPSLADHIGEDSTLWPAIKDHHRRRADRFPGEDFSAMNLLTSRKIDDTRSLTLPIV